MSYDSMTLLGEDKLEMAYSEVAIEEFSKCSVGWQRREQSDIVHRSLHHYYCIQGITS